MQTKTYHISNLGSYAPLGLSDEQGYIRYHASKRYKLASSDQLETWSHSRIAAVRNAAITEQAERRLQEWQNGN